MKFIFFSLILSFNVLAAEEFGGITFHSSVEPQQTEAFKNDLKYLFQSNYYRSDKEFLGLVKMPTAKGPDLHNWLLNRIKFIVGENYSREVSYFLDHRNTELDIRTGMSNLSGNLYRRSRDENRPMGLNLDGIKVVVESPRVGILQVGPALFTNVLNSELYSPLNILRRLSILFHEARHSDGNGKSLAFSHINCPRDHYFKNMAACEFSTNGSYTVGALALRYMLKNCSQCSEQEKLAIETSILDYLGRVLRESDFQLTELKLNRKYFIKVMSSYQDMLAKEKVQANKDRYAQEIERLNLKLEGFNSQIKTLEAAPKPSLVYDDAPEGKWTPMSLKESTQLMKRSINAQ